MKKRILSALLAAMLTLSLCACAAKAGPQQLGDDSESLHVASTPALQPDAGNPGDAPPFERARLWEESLQTVVADFAAVTTRHIANGGDNALFSPVSLWLCLGMLTEGASGDTHAQLMDAMGAQSAGDALPYREIEDFFWSAWDYSYSMASFFFGDEEEDNTLPGFFVNNSLWVGQDNAVRDSYLSSLAYNWEADIFDELEFGSEEAAAAMEEWIRESTGGRLGMPLSPDENAVLIALSTLYLRDGWMDAFEKSDTHTAPFTLPGGNTMDAEFMTQRYSNHGYHQGENYLQTVQFLQNGAEVHFVLPDEDTTLADLLADEAAMSAILRQQYGKYASLHLEVPKFSFDAVPDVKGALQALGATDAFDASLADFSIMTEPDSTGDTIFLSQLVQNTTISVNEAGLEAAAVTAGEAAATGIQLEQEDSKIQIVLDRPFLFFIRYQGMPLFVGTVAQPSQPGAEEITPPEDSSEPLEEEPAGSEA